MPLGPADRDALIALLDFHVAAGIDLALDEAPHDRFAEDSRPEPAPPRDDHAAPEPPASRAPVPPGRTALPRSGVTPAATAATSEIAADARRLAAEAETLIELEALVAAFEGCTLKA